ncbi:CCA tRNA nucleotidyltransferase [Chitinophaga sp. RCC_12]|uniref:CCA tRNA nucleotidyltransferase n=1 Tax=Chitinophaga sp. RCC_12 TaxID=3239226 RepID=UPI003523AE74
MISSKPLDIPCSLQERKVLEKIALAAQELGVPAYLIGGFVRDKLLGRKTKDMDIVCVGDGIALAHKVAANLGNNIPVNFFKTYGTAQVKLNDLEIEFVGARKESYREESRNPEVSAGTLQDDQNRRDFTINAMAISLRDIDYGSLLDPFDGLVDLDKKIIRTPLAPAQTFSDDPLRMMRGIRFASQLQFTIEESTFTAIQENAERIRIISQERISDEFNKIMLSTKPSVGLDLLYQSGLLKIIFPQMIDMVGVEMYEGKGHKDNFYHTLQVVDNISENTRDLWLRWAALLHDIGKPATKKFEPGHGWTFHGHDAVGGKMVPRIFSRMKLPMSEKMRLVKKLVELHLRPISLTKENITDSAIRRLLFDAGDDIEGLMMLCEADITSKNKTKVKRYLENFELVRRRLKEVEESDRIRNWQPPITGEMIMETFGLKPGRIVGDLKSAIREAILDGEIPNTYEAAYAFLLEKAGALNLSPVK